MPCAPVIIVVPPAANLAFPALGPSILAAACRRDGVDAHVIYANAEYAARVGFDLYQRVGWSPLSSMVGEALMRAAAFGEDGGALEAAMRGGGEGLDAVPIFDAPDASLSRADLERMAARVPAWVDATVSRILACAPRIVGFSSVFQQTLASVALARALKARAPEVLTVLGGPNAAEPMGSALAEVTDAFDHVFSGEADLVFPVFCKAFLANGERPSTRVVSCPMVGDMDRVPLPAYDDYFVQIRALQADDRLPPELPRWLHFETSRGCWYGEKHHCTFCGLNGAEMAYRSRGATRVLTDLETLANTWGIRRLRATDNILPRSYVRDVLPALPRGAAGEPVYELAWEVKANVEPRDLDAFVAAGLREIQPGIESLSSHVLKCMDKGTTGLRNVRLLRECRARDLRVFWNVLFALPGERPADYADLVAIAPMCEHLQPPQEWGPIGIDRFSPYHARPQSYGIDRVEPFPVYRALYGARADLDRLAYHFRGVYRTVWHDDGALRSRVEEALGRWSRAWQVDSPPRLEATRMRAGGLLIVDTRACATQRMHALGTETAALLDALRSPLPEDRVAQAQRPAIDRLVASRLVVRHEGQLLSLVVERPETP